MAIKMSGTGLGIKSLAIKAPSATGLKVKDLGPKAVTSSSPVKDLTVKATVAPIQGHSAFTTGLGKGYELATRSPQSTARLSAAVAMSKGATSSSARET